MYRRMYRAPVWREMDRLQREMNRLLNSATPRTQSAPGYPAMNVWTREDKAVITAEIPDVAADDLEITVIGDQITLSGERKTEELEEGSRYHRRERGSGKFSRSLELPFVVEADAVEAHFRNGVLEVELPRAEADKPRKIAVKSN